MKRFLLGVFTILILTMTGCPRQPVEEIQENPDFSDYYLVGFDYGVGGFDEPIYNTLANVIICTDHTVQVYLPHVDETNGIGDYELRETLTLTDEQYSAIEGIVDRDRMWNLDVEETEVCDGLAHSLDFYDDNLDIVGYYGGFVAESDEAFWSAYNGVLSNVPLTEIADIRNAWVTESYVIFYGEDLYGDLDDPNAQMMLINDNINMWMNYDPNLADWYNTYAVTDFDDDGYLEICVCKTYNNGPSSIISIYEVTEKGIMTGFDTGLMDDYPDLVIDHYTEPIGFVCDDEGNCIYHVCNIVDNGIEGAEHRYGAMYFENNTMHFDEITEEEYNDNEEEVTLGWFTDITSENISDSYNVFVKGA